MFIEITIENPYVGLRPFQTDENLLFFGRKEQTSKLLQKLHHNRFLAVVGGSGSGKSSLVRAGLIPKLKAGFLVTDRDSWYIAVMRPGGNPIHNLVISILEAMGLKAEQEVVDQLEILIREEGVYGLQEYLRPYLENQRFNFLVLVDQFEEIFRYKSETFEHEDLSAGFVSILLALAQFKELPIYVVLTMRSDFIGDCDLFYGLPEAMNHGQYLVPRLDRLQRREVIEGPIRLLGKKVAPRLTDQILNDVGDEQDQLPILQHVLMKVWDCASQEGADMLDLEHYKTIGGAADALSQHADYVYNLLSSEKELYIAEILFKRITDQVDESRGIRRPTAAKEICEVADCDLRQLIEVIEVFRKEKRSFLTPPVEVPLDEQSIIDISHESLMRNWERLKIWISEERESANRYIRLSGNAELFEKNRANLLGKLGVATFSEWREKRKPNEKWASRYNSLFNISMNYLDRSIADQIEIKKEEKKRRRQRRLFLLLTIILPIITFLSIYSLMQRNKAVNQRDEKEVERLRAERESDRADSSLNIAVFEKLAADSARQVALVAKGLADSSRQVAIFERNQAHIARDKAEVARKDAIYQQQQAEIAKKLAEERFEQIMAQDAQIVEQKAEITEKVGQSNSNALVAAAFQMLTRSPDISFRLAEAAYNGGQGSVRAVSALRQAFYAGLNKAEFQSMFSKDGRYVATRSLNGELRLWDLDAEAHNNVKFSTRAEGINFYFSQSSRYFIVVSPYERGGDLSIYHRESGAMVFEDVARSLHGDFQLTSPQSFNGYMALLAFSYKDSSAAFVHPKEGLVVLQTHEEGFTKMATYPLNENALSLAFSPSGSQIAALLENGRVEVYDIIDQRIKAKKQSVQNSFPVYNSESIVDYSTVGEIVTIELFQFGNASFEQQQPRTIQSDNLSGEANLWRGKKPANFKLQQLQYPDEAPVEIYKYPLAEAEFYIDDPDIIIKLVNQIQVFGAVEELDDDTINEYTMTDKY